MKTPKPKPSGPFANRARATEIALMDEFGLAEFIELTGVGDSDYGIYRIRPTGVSLCASENLTGLPASQQNAINKLVVPLNLKFPCTPAAFVIWYDATRGGWHPKAPKGQQGLSDFPLAKGFAEELQRQEGPSSESAGQSVPSAEIVAAFKVLPAEGENARWWDLRLRNPGRYRLTSARALRGSAKRPSRWYPVRVAGWLIDQKHLALDAALSAMRKSFPDHDADYLLV